MAGPIEKLDDTIPTDHDKWLIACAKKAPREKQGWSLLIPWPFTFAIATQGQSPPIGIISMGARAYSKNVDRPFKNWQLEQARGRIHSVYLSIMLPIPILKWIVSRQSRTVDRSLVLPTFIFTVGKMRSFDFWWCDVCTFRRISWEYIEDKLPRSMSV